MFYLELKYKVNKEMKQIKMGLRYFLSDVSCFLTIHKIKYIF